MIDGTNLITAIHQNHDYGHLGMGDQPTYWSGDEVPPWPPPGALPTAPSAHSNPEGTWGGDAGRPRRIFANVLARWAPAASAARQHRSCGHYGDGPQRPGDRRASVPLLAAEWAFYGRLRTHTVHEHRDLGTLGGIWSIVSCAPICSTPHSECGSGLSPQPGQAPHKWSDEGVRTRTVLKGQDFFFGR